MAKATRVWQFFNDRAEQIHEITDTRVSLVWDFANKQWPGYRAVNRSLPLLIYDEDGNFLGFILELQEDLSSVPW